MGLSSIGKPWYSSRLTQEKVIIMIFLQEQLLFSYFFRAVYSFPNFHALAVSIVDDPFKNNNNFLMKTDFVTAGTVATVYILPASDCIQ